MQAKTPPKGCINTHSLCGAVHCPFEATSLCLDYAVVKLGYRSTAPL